MRLLKLMLLLFVCATGPASAGPYEDARAAFDRGDYATAISLYRPLADQGDADAQFALGWTYNQENGTAEDYAAAMEWYRRSADQGHRVAQYHLGVMYEQGKRVQQDYSAAASWYRRAADQGWRDAQNNLGRAYAQGRGVTKDLTQAYMWFSLAADNLPKKSEGREVAARNRDRVAAKMTSEQIAEALKLAREWKPKLER